MNNNILSSAHSLQMQHEIVDGAVANKQNGLSCEEIIKSVGTQYMKASADARLNQASCFAIPAMPTEIQNGVELAHLLLASAEMTGNKQYDLTARLVSHCKTFSSQVGNPIQRLAYYFLEALRERIERETTGEVNKAPKSAPNFAYGIHHNYGKKEFDSLVAQCTRLFPYFPVLQFTGVQAVKEAVGNAKKIHVIDLGIRTGWQWTVLIQFIAQITASGYSTPELLKITAVGMDAQELKDSGKRLYEFAKSLAVPFSYRMVEISNMEEISEGMFNVKSGEAVAVYAPIILRSLLYDPLVLENLVDIIKKIRPEILVKAEVEAEHNSPSFVNRFIEVLFYYSTYFDSLEIILPERSDSKRLMFEEVFCYSQIRNMIACEGKDRTVRHAKMDVWRCFFKQAGFKEKSFSYQAWYQAILLLNKFGHGECYSLEPDGSAITVGWKGTPLHTLSAWTCNVNHIAW